MEKIALSVFIGCFMALNVYAQTELPLPKFIPPYKYIASGQFDAMLGSMPNTPDESSKNQALENLNTFLGRADLNSALNGIPSGKACVTNDSKEQPGSTWMLDHAKDARVIMFNENHLTLASRTFVRSHLQELRTLGFTHIGFEAFAPFGDVPDEATLITYGYYTIEPMFLALIREAIDLGFQIFGYEDNREETRKASGDELFKAREQGQTQNIIEVINSAPNGSKFIIYAGWSHIAKEPLPAQNGKMRWMASLFKEQSGIDPLSVDLTQCFYTSDGNDEWKGKVFITENGLPLVQGSYAGAVDAQIYLPVPRAELGNLSSYYRSALGKSFQIPDELRSAIFPVLVQARFVGHGKSAIAQDRILLRPGEDLPLYLKGGEYEITSYRGDGSILGELVVHIE